VRGVWERRKTLIHAHQQRGYNFLLHRITTLSTEQEHIYLTALHRVIGLTIAEHRRLDQIAWEIAQAQDAVHQANEHYLQRKGNYQ
jgi:hypothetical protein